ncbi:pyruvate dehydrogenase E2 component (dihydrolipoamide acetyltransferase) [Endobacter medicaginis]|uniref:Acetyltransferase component of pyruvate dehydrogenase complex n=2 Tax=Pseudomonadota TaxID=1224 RepID=A0A839UR99_9PROT|nr:pyruvate dehydrogenase complex dihydrolipoamide acetyltransferase [Endobacter medicaginis]MBB3172728.1 pyruvate dehydrogenase E2 component (dihydrolipoamide acetyltransferase) [Endobacter medicaginis]MCX5474335.1 pyruvate dehydrogenase complex dihydrolipoamide acetyltransferase [Endobacter medicaginis]NVN30216.1 pyruvate dehydrogenase complex dihydrolipoamide acetyltransferase [Endobacter medicaginis]
MATNILMPALSPTMTEGTLARWLKKEGDSVKSGEVIAEIETDKATMEVEAVDEGILGRILIADGTEAVAVNTPIGILVEQGESVPESAAAAASKPEATPAPEPVKAEAPAPKPVSTSAAPAARRVIASPLARRLAKEQGIDLSTLKGSGPNGRILRRDLQSAPEAAPAAAAAKPATATGIAAPHQAIRNSNIRKVTARRLTESKQQVPHFYVTIDVELDRLLDLRKQLNALSPAEGPDAFKMSVNDMLIKAAAVTLRRVPKVNASYTDAETILYDEVDISVAVSIPDGLITPIVRSPDRKTLPEVAREARVLIEKARAGKLRPEEFQGGTFSISNMGMFGVREFAAIINPPQAAILAFGAGDRRAVVRSGDKLEIATVMSCTLSVDHRVVDGALAAEFMAKFKEVVEHPMTLVI